jgi:TetR/AcrR family transcriptional repressor of mexJK operon
MRVKNDERRQRIIEVACPIFLEKGYERTSMSEIAGQLGGSKGTLYSYFPSKKDLFAAVIAHSAALYMEAVLPDSIDLSDMVGTLKGLSEHTLLTMCSQECVTLNRNVFSEAGMSDIGQLFYQHAPLRILSRLAQIMERWMAEGKLRLADGFVAAQQLFALLEAEVRLPLLLGVMEPGSAIDVPALSARAIDAFLRIYGLPVNTCQA